MTATALAALLAAGTGQSQTAVQQPVSPAQAQVPDQADTETLRDALIQTYRSNPTLTAQRAQVRTLDEGVAIAKAQGRPQLSATAGVNQDLTRTGGGNGRNFNAGVDLSLPLFQGGRVRNSVRAADARVLAGRANLRATQGDIFTEAVAAYMDVIRDRSVVTLNRNQVGVLETNLQASEDRFEVGDLTRTDVAQSEARLSLARSNLATAEGQLEGSEENYRRVIGELPGDLQPPPPLPPLPQTPDQAVEIALANNQDLVSIQNQVRAAGLDVRVASADRLPTVSAIGSGRYTNFLGSQDGRFGTAPGELPNTETVTGAGVQATIPLYQGGLVGARVRQAQAFQSQLIEQGIEIERAVVANSRAAFASYQAALDAIESNEIAVAANQLALEGTRAEQSVGTRNVLDVLNAEQELLNSQVALVTARRDAYVAGFQLLNAMGQAEIEDLNLDGGYIYDPAVNYERVSDRASDWDSDPQPQPVATRTVGYGPPENTPVTPSDE
ncbi:TolC family outer membrane protein [Sphingosinicella humi]|uniref:TolC family outer membrane protein n=1 Tax=Allosphingosinicella humi TaxID=2068657 RepID=UPI001FB11CDD|nr:TolC family outer membrane protein [Sphingosinicella humi]